MVAIRINIKTFWAGVLGTGLHYQTSDLLHTAQFLWSLRDKYLEIRYSTTSKAIK